MAAKDRRSKCFLSSSHFFKPQPPHNAKEPPMCKSPLFLIFSFAFFGCATTNQRSYVSNVVFDGENIKDPNSGLIVYAEKDKPIVAITSYYGDFNVILPYAKWTININQTYPLMASSDKGTVSIMFERFTGSPAEHLTDIKANLLKSPFGSATNFEYRTFDSTKVLVSRADVSELVRSMKEMPAGARMFKGVQTGLYSVKEKADGTHAIYHYSCITDSVLSEEKLQRLVKHATLGFTPNFKEATRAGKT